jgi:DNA-directed RNA polymerase specialized sigma24 family protein
MWRARSSNVLLTAPSVRPRASVRRERRVKTGPGCYWTEFSILRNKEDVEDTLQDALCGAYASLASFRGQSSFSTWLTRVVEILESKPQK